MTIVDIAKESGYSVTTVSRVLNNRRDVSPAAKKKIMEIVEAHNFVPNNNAKRLKQTKTKSILVVAKGTSNMLFTSIVEEIQKTVELTDFALGIHYLDEECNEVEEAIRYCRERKPIGILFLGCNPQYFKEQFKHISVPCILVTNSADDWEFDNLSSVSTDDVRGAEKAVDYLITNGHRDIAVIGGDLSASRTSNQRHKGYLKSMEAHGLLVRPEYYEKSRFSFDSAYEAMNRLLDKEIPISALFAMSDVTAIGAIRAIRDRGLSVPEDISVIGYDGTMLADYYNPKIVSIRQGYQEIAARSVETLIGMIDLNRPATHELIPFTLTDGESVRKL